MRYGFTTPFEQVEEFLADAKVYVPACPRPPTRSPDAPLSTR